MPQPVTRLSLVSHAATAAMRRARFNSDEPVDDAGLRHLGRSTFTDRFDSVSIAPELRTRQTAEAFGLHGTIVGDIADIDYGRWAGLTMDELPESDLMSWLTDTSTTPPGGESIDGLLGRVDGWMQQLGRERLRLCAVTHPAVIRAVVVRTLDAPASAFWRVDIPPVTCTTVHFRSGRWTLRATAEKII